MKLHLIMLFLKDILPIIVHIDHILILKLDPILWILHLYLYLKTIIIVIDFFNIIDNHLFINNIILTHIYIL